jgi:hypothetical protein
LPVLFILDQIKYCFVPFHFGCINWIRLDHAVNKSLKIIILLQQGSPKASL